MPQCNLVIKNKNEYPFTKEQITNIKWLKANIPELKYVKSAKLSNLGAGMEGREMLDSGGGMASDSYRLLLEYDNIDTKESTKGPLPKSLVVKFTSTHNFLTDMGMGFFLKNWWITRCFLWKPFLYLGWSLSSKFAHKQYGIPKNEWYHTTQIRIVSSWIMFCINEALFYSHKTGNDRMYKLTPKAYYGSIFASKAGILKSKAGHHTSYSWFGIEDIQTCVIMEDLAGYKGPKGK